MSGCFDFHEKRSVLNSSFLFLAASCERNAASRFQSADAAEAWRDRSPANTRTHTHTHKTKLANANIHTKPWWRAVIYVSPAPSEIKNSNVLNDKWWFPRSPPEENYEMWPMNTKVCVCVCVCVFRSVMPLTHLRPPAQPDERLNVWAAECFFTLRPPSSGTSVTDCRTRGWTSSVCVCVCVCVRLCGWCELCELPVSPNVYLCECLEYCLHAYWECVCVYACVCVCVCLCVHMCVCVCVCSPCKQKQPPSFTSHFCTGRKKECRCSSSVSPLAGSRLFCCWCAGRAQFSFLSHNEKQFYLYTFYSRWEHNVLHTAECCEAAAATEVTWRRKNGWDVI